MLGAVEGFQSFKADHFSHHFRRHHIHEELEQLYWNKQVAVRERVLSRIC